MSNLTLHANIADPDAIYDQLISLHRGLSDADSARVNNKLILLLANHIGDHATLEEAISHAANTGVNRQ